jgi:hypothetical protein
MPNPFHIDEEHNNAIRAEVGERLRIILRLEGATAIDRSSGRSRTWDRVENVTIDCAFGKRRLAPSPVAKANSLIFTTHPVNLVTLQASRPNPTGRI